VIFGTDTASTPLRETTKNGLMRKFTKSRKKKWIRKWWKYTKKSLRDR
jgi:hypothetical protein